MKQLLSTIVLLALAAPASAGLIERLCKTEPSPNGVNSHVHQFKAALGELERGKATRAQVIAAFGVTPAEEPELDAIIAKVRSVPEPVALPGRVVLTNVGNAYDATADAQALPFVVIESAGVTRIDLRVKHRKAGSGTHDYQLYDETNDVVALDSATATSGGLTDAAAAGDHSLTASRTFAAPLPPGLRELRLRVKSTTAADDPTFLGASVLVYRVDVITSEVLHEVLLLGEDGILTPAQVRTRLGLP